MGVINLKEIASNVNRSQIDLAFDMSKSVDKGNFSEKITLNILNFTKAKFVNNKYTYKKQRRISYFLIETLQNVIRHRDIPESDDIDSEGLLLIQKTKDTVYITTGNVIENEKCENFENYLFRLKNFNKEELDKEFSDILLNGEITEKGGGGIGLLTMVRRTQGEMNYKFKKINDKYSFFYYQIQVVFGEEEYKDNSNNGKVSLNRIAKFHELLSKESILLNFNGTFAFDNLKNILPFIEEHSIGSKELKQKVFDLTVTALKNTIVFADDFADDINTTEKFGKGIFILSKKGGKLFLTAGNIIANTKTVILQNKINIINNTENNSLVNIQKYLNQFYSTKTHNLPDIGLIEMKLRNKSKINYIFKPINTNVSYFILQLAM